MKNEIVRRLIGSFVHTNEFNIMPEHSISEICFPVMTLWLHCNVMYMYSWLSSYHVAHIPCLAAKRLRISVT